MELRSMPQQLSMLEATRPTDRLFFAIFPPVDIGRQLLQSAQGWRNDHGMRSPLQALDRLHVTLHHVGDHEGLPEALVAAAREAAASVAESAFEFSFDRVVSFGRAEGKRPFVLRGGEDVASLTKFQQAIGMAMRKAGLGRWVQLQFTPHMTLLYDDRLVGEQIVQAVGWRVNEFLLVHSLLGRTQHIVLGRWPLRG
jgi:2'-5' RNA ligase